MNARTHKLAQTLGLALVLVVAAAPTAIGSGRQASGLDPWAYNAVHRDQAMGSPRGENATGLRDLDPWAYSRVLRSRSSTPMGENATGQNAIPAATRPDDRPGIRGPSTPVALPQLGQVDYHGAFDWRDAGIGALATLAAALVATSATLLALRRRRASQPIGELGV
ncbi:MAG TPA: hypothetical protein VE596_05840 [Gaiellaceae bacterium]|jgi:hypothetical protein|nr:hypothetical protein [Gaiellaceae bacterium]